MKRTSFIYLIILFLIYLPLYAQDQVTENSEETVSSIPSKISYQGVLTDNNGDPLNGQYDMQFRLYTSSSGGTEIWDETQNNINVNEGIFNVYLGSNNPLSGLAFDVSYWLEITVSGTTLTPRIELSSSVYSFNTSRIQGRPISENAPTTGQVLKWNGSEWLPDNDETGGGLWSQFSNGIYYNGGKVLVGTTSSSGDIQLESTNSYPNGAAIAGYDYQNSSGTGIFGYSNGFAAIQGNGTNANYAGYFMGDVHVSGTLSKPGGSFEIDHPLDPANKILRHSSMESPDMMNVYNGNVTTDASGYANIQLPAYFEALNKDFRYQLTVIGQFAQAMVSQEIQNNNFTIQTDKPNVKVSWQVTGVRKDPWAGKNRIIVEEEKSLETRGYYLTPGAYNLPQTRSIEWALHPEMMKQIEEKSGGEE